ncbi:hypothetical protein HYFRA_00009815 [Hymenoscyphus fraxineus]|uniref:Uncharacterized protein n=1 Tax=Hymenoscyphus fraxineus TaxID=746836 RepID=A0A9N9L4M5_9HELO|nr:hypothetical protein HYFRA_00009815 [Hymenoscyphus fraxineus]
MAHHHPAKRPYNGSQPSITSYFSAATPDNPAFSNSTSPEQRHLPPTNVQANLLSVGMRVRKSVPEGYKTGSQYSSFALFSDPSSANAPVCATPNAAASPRTKMGSRPRARELTPFCGILKIGGLAQQVEGVYASSGRDVEDEEELGFPGFDSSQGSTSSFSSFETTARPFGDIGLGNKRRFEEEEEDDVVVRSMGGRAIAVPKRKKDGKMGAVGVPAFAYGQENANDFQDAEFLDYKLATEEVEMSGV